LRLAWLGTLLLLACGSSSAGPPPDDGGIKNSDHETGPDAGGDAIPLAPVPTLVFVDGVVDGTTQSTSGLFLELGDVRVCVFDVAKSAFVTQHPLPYDAPMPLTNYPGLRQGTGMDFGTQPTQVRLDIYSATGGLETDAVWSQTSHTCLNDECDGGGPPCFPHVSLTVTLDLGVNVVALVDDPSADGGATVKLLKATFADKTFAGAESSLSGTVVNFSGWPAGGAIGAFYGDPSTDAGADTTISSSLAADTSPPPDQIAANIGGDYDTHAIYFDQLQQPFERFGQTLDSIAYVANAAVSPTVFYDVRENFVFALVGDPNDTSGVQLNGGRNPQFNRRGLHIAAVPYATPHL
jgi:hypothetical protein